MQQMHGLFVIAKLLVNILTITIKFVRLIYAKISVLWLTDHPELSLLILFYQLTLRTLI